MLLGIGIEHGNLIRQALGDGRGHLAQRAPGGHGEQLPLAGFLEVVKTIEGCRDRGAHDDGAVIAHHQNIVVAEDGRFAVAFARGERGALAVLVIGDLAVELQTR